MAIYQNSRISFLFDAGGRELQTSQITDTATTVTDDNTGLSRTITAHVDTESHKTYDTENHTHSVRQTTTSTRNGAPQAPSDGTSTIGWGPNGHPVQFRNSQGSALTLHWDGDALLFVSDASGTVVDFKVGTDGETAPGNTGGVTVYDRDTAGVVVMTSNATGNSGLEPLDSSDLSGSYPPTSSYQAPTQSYFDTNRADGYNFGTFRINGVRAFDATLGSWTTPDAYAGDVHDPASQQRYMWNRNNPYEYSDPSGYFPEQVFADGGGGVGSPSAGVQVASYDASAELAIGDALLSIENLINKLNRGTNPTNPQQYLGALKAQINYALKNNNNGAYTVDFKPGQQTPTLVSKNGVFRIYVSMKEGYTGPAELRGSIRLDVRNVRNTEFYRYFNRDGMLWRGYKNYSLPAIPFGLTRFGKE